MSQRATETPVLDLIAGMTAASAAASNLDAEAFLLARLAALVAVDAPTVSYALNLGAAAELDLDPEHVRGVLAAIAPVVGTARIASAMGKIAEALAISVEIAELEAAAQSQG